MILSGKDIQDGNLVGDMISGIQFQPAGIDLSVKEVHAFLSPGKIDFDNKERKLSETRKLDFEKGELFLSRGNYKIIYNEYVKIPKDCIALGFTRSSLLRSGASIAHAVWDPGYEGRSESLLVVHNDHGITLKQNARVSQLVFSKLANGHVENGYSGVYHGENKHK